MDRTNPTFNFMYDSEDSDSSSSSEKEKKRAYLQKQALTENIKPSEISIQENELEALIKRIEIITKLNNSDIESPIFDENAKSKMQLFLTTYAQETLFTYYMDGRIIADFSIPKSNSSNAMYFVKLISNDDEPSSVVFLKSIIFGTLDPQLQETTISSLKMVFVCSFNTMESLPYRIKRRITKNMEDFLLQLTESYYRNSGISEIYLPAIGFFNTDQINRYVRTDDVINSLESTIVQWCHLVSEAIHDNEIDFYTVKDFNILTLLNFWEYRWHNLNLISKYLKDERSTKLNEILQHHNSVHLKFLSNLQEELNEKIIECQSIIDHLIILKKIHQKLNTSEIETIHVLLPELFRTVNAIITQSPYFQIWENTKLLVISVSKQIIDVCRMKFSIEDILQGKTTESMKNIIESVKTCHLYNQMLKRGILNTSNWEDNSQTVCSCTDTFMQRCNDLLELCSMINIFCCSQNNGRAVHITIEQHIGVEENLEFIYNRFSSNLDHFKQIQDKILYVQCTDWYNAADRFQIQMQEIENEIKAFTEKSLSYVTTTEDELNVLRIMYHYSKLHPLKAYLMGKNDRLINNILKETREIKQRTFFLSIKHLISNASQLDLVTETFLKKRRLQFLSQMLNESSWLPKSELLDEAKGNFRENIIVGNQFIVDNYKQWLEQLRPTILNQLKRPLVAKCFYKAGLLEVNIDRKLLKIIKESRSWIQIGLKLPVNLDKLANTFAQILILYGNVEDLVMNYNRIISGLSPAEYILFTEIVNVCSDTINPTLYTMQWDFEQSNDTVLNYLKHIKYVENMVNSYKHYNKQIIETCKSICSLNFLLFFNHDIEEIWIEIYTSRLICLKKIIHFYNAIASYIQTLFNSFGYHIHKMKDIWNLYIEKVDSLIESALLYCTKNSLTKLLGNFSSISGLNDDSLIEIIISVAVQDEKIKFNPDLNEILKFFSHVDIIILEGLKVIPRLYNKFKLMKGNRKISYAKQLMINEDIARLRESIVSVIFDNLAEVRDHLKLWNRYKMLWKIDASEYAEQYCNNCSSASSYGTDFNTYSWLIKEIGNSNHIEKISIFSLNAKELANEIVSQCKNRLQHLSNVLRKFVTNLLKNIDSYVIESDRKLNEKIPAKDYINYVNQLNSDIAQKEQEIQQIQDYIHTLRQFKFQRNLETTQKEMLKNWKKYKNTLERCKLKVKIMYDVKI